MLNTALETDKNQLTMDVYTQIRNNKFIINLSGKKLL